MECCFQEEEGCGAYTVVPMLVPPCRNTCSPAQACYPCLPSCEMYCCAKKPQKVVYCCREVEKPPARAPPKPCKPPVCKPPPCCEPESCCKPVKTKYIIPCYRYEDGRIVRQLPVSAFKRNGMQDQEHSKLLGTTNFLVRNPRDVSFECDICSKHIKVGDPAKIPCCASKRPIKVDFEDKNQPTSLTRRACEVACGNRPSAKPCPKPVNDDECLIECEECPKDDNKPQQTVYLCRPLRQPPPKKPPCMRCTPPPPDKPFVLTSFRADKDSVTQSFHSADNQGNYCYHEEKKTAQRPPCCYPPCGTGPQCDYVPCQTVSPSCCYYCK